MVLWLSATALNGELELDDAGVVLRCCESSAKRPRYSMCAVASPTVSSMSPQRTSGPRRRLSASEADKGEPLSVLEKAGWQTSDKSVEQSRCHTLSLARCCICCNARRKQLVACQEMPKRSVFAVRLAEPSLLDELMQGDVCDTDRLGSRTGVWARPWGYRPSSTSLI